MSVQSRVYGIIIAIMVVGFAGYYTNSQIEKGAYFHQLNVLHYKHSVELDDALRELEKKGSWSKEDTRTLEAAVVGVKRQPEDCLRVINVMDRMVMELIKTDIAIRLCEEDLAAGERALAAIKGYRTGRVNRIELRNAMVRANVVFKQNSDAFVEPIDKTVTFIVSVMTWFLPIVSLLVACFAWLIGRSIIRPINALTVRSQDLSNGDVSSEVPGTGRSDELGTLAKAVEASRQTSQKVAGLVEEQQRSNESMRRVMDNVGQGLFTIDLQGAMSPERSSAVREMLGEIPEEVSLPKHLEGIDPAFAEMLELGLEDLSDGFLPSCVVLAQLPSRLHKEDVTLGFEYELIEEEGGEASGILVIVTDLTEILIAQQAQARSRETAVAFSHFVKDPGGLENFLAEGNAFFKSIPEDHTLLARQLHTIKGNSGIFGFTSFSRAIHKVEDLLKEEGALSDAHFADVRLIWADINERVSPWLSERANFFKVERQALDDALMAVNAGAELTEVGHILHAWQCEPVKSRLDSLGRYAQELATRLGKADPDIVVDGGNVRAEPGAHESIWGSLVHLIRNAVDHGLPDAQDGKTDGAWPKLTLRAALTSEGLLQIFVEDNGQGIDWERVRYKAQTLGIPARSHEDLVDVLFSDGFSTRDTANLASGRGVGLSALRADVNDANGAIHVKSERGKGTSFIITLPGDDYLSYRHRFAKGKKRGKPSRSSLVAARRA